MCNTRWRLFLLRVTTPPQTCEFIPFPLLQLTPSASKDVEREMHKFKRTERTELEGVAPVGKEIRCPVCNQTYPAPVRDSPVKRPKRISGVREPNSANLIDELPRLE